MEVYIWADGSFHNPEDGEAPSWKSDDYKIVEVPELIDEDLEDWIFNYVNEVYLGDMCERRTRCS